KGLGQRADTVEELLRDRPRLTRRHPSRPSRSTSTQNTASTASYGGSIAMYPRCASIQITSSRELTAFHACPPPPCQRFTSTAEAPCPLLRNRSAIGVYAARPRPTNSNRRPSHRSARATPPASPVSSGLPIRSYSGCRGAATTGSPCQVDSTASAQSMALVARNGSP